MANFMQEHIVRYACSCGILNPIGKLFFCRHCPKLRCGFCVSHEVDSHFCSNCLENIPSSEARHKKNCCANCFDCPSCGHTLSARATTVVVPKKSEEPAREGESEAGRVVTKKMYYLACQACRWTSRDAGLPDQATATGAWPENECSYQTRFNSLLEYYQAVVLQDKQEKQEYLRRKTPKTHKIPSLTDRTGLTVSMIRRQIGWTDTSTQKPKPVNITPAVASEDVEPLPANIFTEPIKLMNLTTIKQRHSQPAQQPFSVDKLYPQRRLLWIKRSLRCRQCEHNVIKPEYHPTSIKYRIQLFASYHVPDVLLVRCEQPLRAGQLCNVILKLSNPTMHDMTIKIFPLPSADEELEMIDELKKYCNIKDTSLSNANDSLKSLIGNSSASLAQTSLTRQVSLTEEPRVVQEQTTAKLELKTIEFLLNQRDDSKEYDEDVQVTPKEDTDFIVWRKANKVSIRLAFIPLAELQPGADVILGFTMQHTYVNTVTNTPEKKEPTTHDLKSRIYVNVGQIEAEA